MQTIGINDADCREPRHYQRVVDAFTRGQKRMMLVMATSTGKAYTEFQIMFCLLQSSKISNKESYYNG